MKINKLELVFENCESMSFDNGDIEHLSISVNEKNFSKYRIDTKLDVSYSISELSLTLNKISNKEYHPFDINDEEYNTTKFDRIKEFMDITQIIIEYENNKIDLFYIYFKDNDENINSNQTVKEDIEGNLKIMILQFVK